MSNWPILLFPFAILFTGGFMSWLAYSHEQPHNLPTPADVRQYLLDCEQFSPGKKCTVVAMPVPDFSDRGSDCSFGVGQASDYKNRME